MVMDPAALRPPLADVTPPLTVCGFWRRLAALALDALVLALLGIVSGSVLFDWYAGLGAAGRLIGFTVALAYFTILNSARGGGRTAGKRLMGITVVDRAGRLISVPRSLARYLILGVPFFLNGPLPLSLVGTLAGYLIALVVAGLGGAIVYLYVFNRRTRQSLHDLWVGTYVVRGGPPGPVAAPAFWRPHWVVVGVWGLVVLAGTSLAPWLKQVGAFADSLAVQNRLAAVAGVRQAAVFSGANWTLANGTQEKTTFVRADVVWRGHPADFAAAADQVAAVVLANYPDINGQDALEVRVAYGYDIGIAQAWIREVFRRSPREWQGRLPLLPGATPANRPL